MGELTVHTGTWMPEDRFASPWHYLPVEVAPGTAALRVALEYDRAGAVLDLGCLGPSGFRGWSGGARESFVIGAESGSNSKTHTSPSPARSGRTRIPSSGGRRRSEEVRLTSAGKRPRVIYALAIVWFREK